MGQVQIKAPEPTATDLRLLGVALVVPVGEHDACHRECREAQRRDAKGRLVFAATKGHNRDRDERACRAGVTREINTQEPSHFNTKKVVSPCFAPTQSSSNFRVHFLSTRSSGLHAHRVQASVECAGSQALALESNNSMAKRSQISSNTLNFCVSVNGRHSW